MLDQYESNLNPMPKTIHTVAAVITNKRGEVLLVRKRSSSIFIQPGGKTEPGEQPLPALARELQEELGVHLDISSAVRLGEFEADAVHELGRASVSLFDSRYSRGKSGN